MCLAQSPPAQAVAKITVGRHGAKLASEIVRVLGIDNQCCVTDDLAQRTPIRAEHGAAASHRFNGRHAETFVEGGVDAGARGVVERWQFGIADKTEGSDVMGEGRLAYSIVNGFSAGPILARENELPAGAGRAFELIEGGDEADMIFSRMFEPRDVEKERRGGLPVGAGLAVGSIVRRRAKSGVVQAIVDNADSIARNIEVTKDVAGSISADRDNGALAVSQALDHDATIEHAQGIVFARDMKWGEIVNRGDHGARARVKQTAIAWDVENIKAVFADEARQECLMPQNVCDRMSKAFRDSDEFESAIEFPEEGHVPFEHKSREVVIARD